MNKAKIKVGIYQVVKIADTKRYFSDHEQLIFNILLQKIGAGRIDDGKRAYPQYYVVNADEFYAQEILDLILTREGEKK